VAAEAAVERQRMPVKGEGSGGSAVPPRSGIPLDTLTDPTVLGSMQRLANMAAGTISASSGVKVDCAVTFTYMNCSPVTVASADRAEALASSEKEYKEGPLTHAMSSRVRVMVSGDGGPTRWQAYRRRLIDAGYEGVLAVPARLDEGMSCAMAFFGPVGINFSAEVVRDATRFADAASQSLNSELQVHCTKSTGTN
jgi:hypothetical protein